MTTHLSQSRSKRSGFTLVELLVAITVIGILVGMLTAAVIPMLRTARETTVSIEMRQLQQQLEQFEIDNGFYPPSRVGQLTVAQLQRYVNLMAPNNREGDRSPADSNLTRLQYWHREVGQFLDQESSLVFWLSGTFKNKQYPITGGWDGMTPALIAAHGFDNGAFAGERNIYYEFRSDQLFGDDGNDEVVEYVNAGAVTDLPAALQGFILEYKQGHGARMDARASAGSDLLFKYRDAATSYAAGFTYVDGSGAFINPDSFQLISFGMDGQPGPSGNAILAGQDPKGEDNICNFAEGRLKIWALANQ